MFPAMTVAIVSSVMAHGPMSYVLRCTTSYWLRDDRPHIYPGIKYLSGSRANPAVLLLVLYSFFVRTPNDEGHTEDRERGECTCSILKTASPSASFCRGFSARCAILLLLYYVDQENYVLIPIH